MKYLTTWLVILLLVSSGTYGNPGEETGKEKDNQNGELSLRLRSVSFIEDNEFFNPIIEGYTLLGFFVQPEIVYIPDSRFSISGGVNALKYSGLNNFTQVRPVFSTTLKFTEKTSLTLGTLAGPDKHRMFDQHFYSERLYNQYVEDGIELTHSGDHFFSDAWISWEHFIFKGDSTREQFTSGESFRYTSSPIAGCMTVEVPLQFQAKHFGGQISDYSAKMQSFFSATGGVRLTFDINGKKGGQAGIEYLQFANWMRSGDSIAGINHGHASQINVFYNYSIARIEAGYWNAHDFFAPNGNPMYSSVSTRTPDLALHNRKILTTHGVVRFFPAAPVEFFLGVDLYYDTDTKKFDQAYTLHLSFDKLIHIVSLKNDREQSQ